VAVTSPTVIVSVPHGAAAGNMLRTGSLARLLDHDRDLRLVILSPLSKDPAFLREVAHPRVSVDDLPAHTPAGLEARLLALMQASYLDSAITESVRIRRLEAKANGTIRWIGAKHLIAKVLAPSMTRKPTRYAVSDRMISHPRADALFETHRPVMLVTSNPGLILAEVPLLRTAARRGVWTAAIDPSWDNFTNKLLPIRPVDRLLVWNDLMRQQAIDALSLETDLPAGDRLHAGERAQQCGLSRSVRADKRHNFPGVHLEADALQNFDPAIGAAQIFHLKHGQPPERRAVPDKLQGPLDYRAPPAAFPRPAACLAPEPGSCRRSS